MFNYGKLTKVSVSEANSVLSDVIDYGLGKTIFSNLGLTAKDFDFVEASELRTGEGVSLRFNCRLDSKQFIAWFILGYASQAGYQDVLNNVRRIDLSIEVELFGDLGWTLIDFYEGGRVVVDLVVHSSFMNQLVVRTASLRGINGFYK